MAKTMSAPEAAARFLELVAAIAATGEPVIVEDGGRPVAVVISAARWQELQQAVVDRAWATIEELRRLNAHIDPDEGYADVTAEVEAVRQEMYERGEHGNIGHR